MDTPGQQVLERTSVLVTPEFVEGAIYEKYIRVYYVYIHVR